MKRIHYAGTSFVTGDDIAEGMVRYAAALARSGSAAEITLPVLVDGAVGELACLVGPASQLVAEPATADGDELHDEELVRDLAARAAALEARWVGSPASDLLDYDL